MDMKMYTHTGRREERPWPEAEMSDKSKLEKYDRFEDRGEIIEFTGLYSRNMAHRLRVFKIIEPDPGYEAGDVKVFAKGVFERSSYKKLPPPINHPAVLEAARLTREKPEIRAQYAKALAIQFTASTPAQKREIIELLSKTLPKELRNALICGELCGQCPECSKRIWKHAH
jgi:hypothetical protein